MNKKIFNLLKENIGMVVISALLVMLGIFHKDWLFIMAWLYVCIIKLFMSDFFKASTKKHLSSIIWAIGIFVFISGFYVNHYLPHGPSYPTGEIVCQNDDRGPCGEKYKEDMRELDIPEWAKLLREYGVGILVLLVLAGLCLTDREISK